MSTNNILITGGSGLVGSYLKRRLKDAIYISTVDGDLRDITQVHNLFKKYRPHTVIHLASIVGGILDNMSHPVKYFEDNVLINTNVVMKSHEFNVENFVGILSTCIYPDILDQYPMKEEVLFDGKPPEGNFAYAMSKRALATQINSYNIEYGYDWSYLIPCNLYGEYDKFDDSKSHFVSALLKKISFAKEKITLLGTGKPLRQFMYADDLAKIIIQMLEKELTGIYNVAPNFNYSIHEIAKIGLKACGKDHLKIEFNSSKPDGQYRKDVDSTKLLKNLKDVKFTSLEDGIAYTFEALKKLW